MKLRRFWRQRDGSDWSPAIERAMGEAYERGQPTVELPVGQLRCSRPIRFNGGTCLHGGGAVGSNLGAGTVLVADFDDAPLVTWQGGLAYLGTGGRLRDVTLAAAVGRRPGAAVLITGTTGATRAGWVTLSNVFVYDGADSGDFRYGLVVDGTRISDAGSEGVRDVVLEGCAFAGCRELAVLLRRAWHVYGTVQTMAGTSGCGDVHIVDGSGDIALTGGIHGTLRVATTSPVGFWGYAAKYQATAAAAKTAWLPRAREVELITA